MRCQDTMPELITITRRFHLGRLRRSAGLRGTWNLTTWSTTSAHSLFGIRSSFSRTWEASPCLLDEPKSYGRFLFQIAQSQVSFHFHAGDIQGKYYGGTPIWSTEAELWKFLLGAPVLAVKLAQPDRTSQNCQTIPKKRSSFLNGSDLSPKVCQA